MANTNLPDMDFPDDMAPALSDQIELHSIKSALDIAEMGHWRWPLNGPMHWSPRMCHLLGIPLDEAPKTIADFLMLIAEEEHETILDALDESHRHNRPFDQIITVKHKHTQSNRSMRLIGCLCHLPMQDEPTISGLGYALPHAGSKATVLQSAPIEQFIESSSDLIGELDFQGTFLQANHAWAQFLGMPREHVIGKSFLDLLHPNDISKIRTWLKSLNTSTPPTDTIPNPRGEMTTLLRTTHSTEHHITWTWTADLRSKRIFTITRDTTQAQQKEKQLAQALEQSQRSNAELEAFASTASHDLREPLRMISSYLQLLKERYPEALDSRGRRYVNYASEGATRMRTLIEDLLAYSRIGKASNPHEAVALDDVIAHAIDNLAVAIQKTKAEITVDINEAPIAWGDPIRLTRLFQNLLGNAIKFQAPEQTPLVRVSFEDGAARGQPEKWIIAIEDNGIGIDPDHCNILFNLFQRLNTRDEFEGSGIGLSICKKIVEQHGGEIWFTSTRNKGSSFYVSLNKAMTNHL